MYFPQVNYLAVLVAGIVMFLVGGLWYSPLLFARPWTRLMGRTEEEMQAAASKGLAGRFVAVFIAALITAWVLDLIIGQFTGMTAARGAYIAGICWLGFTGATSFGTSLFSLERRRLWLINTGFYLVAMILAGIILAVWR